MSYIKHVIKHTRKPFNKHFHFHAFTWEDLQTAVK